MTLKECLIIFSYFNMENRLYFLTRLFLLSVCFWVNGVEWVQAEESAQLRCWTINDVGKTESVITMFSGREVGVTCEINGTKGSNEPAVLIGKRSLGEEIPSSVTTSLSVTEGAQEVVLNFPAAFQPGTYQYEFSLFSTSSKELLTKKITLEGSIQGEKQPKFIVVSLEKESYHWQDEFVLSYAIDFPDGFLIQQSGLTLRAVMLDSNGEECAVLDTSLIQLGYDSSTATLKFPETGSCTNTLVFTLINKEGVVLDEYRLAVPLVIPESAVATSMSPVVETSKANMWFVIGGGLVVLVLVFIWFIRRSKR